MTVDRPAASLQRRLADRRARNGANAQTMFLPAAARANLKDRWRCAPGHLTSAAWKQPRHVSGLTQEGKRRGRWGNEAETCHQPPRGLKAETKSGAGRATDLPGASAVSPSHECSIRSPFIVAADEVFFLFLEKAGAELHTFQGRSCKWRGKKPIKACNKNDKRLSIKQETETVNIYHFGFYLADLEKSSALVVLLPAWWTSEEIGTSQCVFSAECSHIQMKWLFFLFDFQCYFSLCVK